VHIFKLPLEALQLLVVTATIHSALWAISKNLDFKIHQAEPAMYHHKVAYVH
jgi:hypothetical protein